MQAGYCAPRLLANAGFIGHDVGDVGAVDLYRQCAAQARKEVAIGLRVGEAGDIEADDLPDLQWEQRVECKCQVRAQAVPGDIDLAIGVGTARRDEFPTGFGVGCAH